MYGAYIRCVMSNKLIINQNEKSVVGSEGTTDFHKILGIN